MQCIEDVEIESKEMIIYATDTINDTERLRANIL